MSISIVHLTSRAKGDRERSVWLACDIGALARAHWRGCVCGAALRGWRRCNGRHSARGALASVIVLTALVPAARATTASAPIVVYDEAQAEGAKVQDPQIAFADGADRYLVGWIDYSDHGGCGYDSRVLATTVASTAQMVSEPRMISYRSPGLSDCESAQAQGLRAVYNPRSQEFLLVWAGGHAAGAAPNDITAQRLSTAGAEVGADDFAVAHLSGQCSACTDGPSPAVAVNSEDGSYLVTWQDLDHTIKAQRLSASGALIGSVRTLSAPASGEVDSSPQLAYDADDHEYLIAWWRGRQGSGYTQTPVGSFAMRLAGDGSPIGGEIAFHSGWSGPGAVLYNEHARQFLIAWQSSPNNGLWFQTSARALTPAGEVLGSDNQVIAESEVDSTKGYRATWKLGAAVDQADGRYVFGWHAEAEADRSDLTEAAVVDSTLKSAGPNFLISPTGGSERPAFAYDRGHDRFLAAWYGVLPPCCYSQGVVAALIDDAPGSAGDAKPCSANCALASNPAQDPAGKGEQRSDGRTPGKLILRLAVPHGQRPLRRRALVLYARCSIRCRLHARLTLRGDGRRRTVLGRCHANGRADRRAKLRVHFSARGQAALRRALSGRGVRRLRVTVVATAPGARMIRSVLANVRR